MPAVHPFELERNASALPLVGSAMSAFRVGLVKEQDAANCRVRVTFLDHDGLLSWWLPIVVPKSQDDKAYWLPDIGEQVVCLMDEHDEDGCVLGAIYSSADAPPVSDGNKFHVSFQDGTSIEYDRATHQLSINVGAGGTISINQGAASITLTGGEIQMTPPPIVYAEAALQ